MFLTFLYLVPILPQFFPPFFLFLPHSLPPFLPHLPILPCFLSPFLPFLPILSYPVCSCERMGGIEEGEGDRGET